jgi:peptidoglycan/LPS O-acetylase OafA/YrhL
MQGKHIVQLDGLRFIGVFSVMIAHWLQWQWGENILSKIPFTHGVLLFFVLSGFLITRILLNYRDEYLNTKEKKSKLILRFYIRRSLRIFPIYYILILILLIINLQGVKDVFIYLLTYTTNIYQYINQADIKWLNHFWSLAVEEQFYLCWPFLILFIKPKRTYKVIVLIIAISIASRIYFYMNNYNWMVSSYSLFGNLAPLGFGGLLAYISMYKTNYLKLISKPVLLYAVLGFYCVMFALDYKYDLSIYSQIFEPILFSIVATLIISRASNNGFKYVAKNFLENKFTVYSGKISYGMYLFHMFIPPLLYWLFPELEEYNSLHNYSKYILFILYYLVTFVIAHISWLMIEKPLNKLKNRYPYK